MGVAVRSGLEVVDETEMGSGDILFFESANMMALGPSCDTTG
jgi:hypothetical protein